MNEKNDNSLEFDDEFDDGFDDSLDDQFYQDTLDENFESDNYDLENFDDEFETEFADELEADFDQEAMPDESLMAKEKKGGLNLSFNTIVIIGAVIVGFIVLVVQVTKAPSGGQGGERFVSALSHQGADDGILSADQGEQANQTNQSEENQSQETLASTQIEDVSQEEAFLFEPDVLDEMGDELNAIPQPAPIMEVEETTDEVSLEPNIEDIVLSNVVSNTQAEDVSTDVSELQQPRPPVSESVAEEPVQEFEQTDELLVVDNSVEESDSLQDTSSDNDADQTQQEMSSSNVAETPTVSVDLSSIEEKLDQITSRLDDMDVQMSQMQGDVSSKIDTVQDNLTKLEKRVETVAARTQQNTSTPRSSSRQPLSPAKPAPKKATPRPQVPNWELKAAQPGKAWIAQKGSSELKPVQIGDRVNGLGQIQNITFDGGRWRVIGSAKSLTQ